METLVDTHIYLWMLSCPEKLSQRRRYELESPANEVFLSAISIAELMIKRSIGKIDIAFEPLEIANKMGLEILSFSCEEARRLEELPLHHKDPFDRMLIAQALTKKLFLMSDDPEFLKYGCRIM